MAEVDYILCLNCESPCYVFVWRDEKIKEAFCETCGEDDPDEFITPSDLDELSGV